MENNDLKIICLTCNLSFCQQESLVPQNVKVARVNCIGRIDPVTVLEMFEKGADAVVLAGCQPPDCHYVEGNLQAERAVKMLKKLLMLAGLEPERLKLVFYSPLETKSLDAYIEEFSQEIRKLAASSFKNAKPEPALMTNILAAKNAASDFRLRVLLGREKELTESVNIYGEKMPQEDFDFLLDEVVAAEFIRHKIHVLTKTKPLSVRDLADAIELKPAAVLRHIVNMRRKNMIGLDHVEGTTPFYRALEV